MTHRRLLGIVISVLLIPLYAGALPNPAALYAKMLGYEYRIEKTPEGEKGIVKVKEGVEFDAWDFYKGKVGSKYAYGEIYGYDTTCVKEDIGSFTREYAVCVSRGINSLKAGARISQQELMQQNNDSVFAPELWIREAYGPLPLDTAKTMPRLSVEQKAELPSQFDWRSVDGKAYIGSVRNQGSCGSCYSFAACAAAEGTYDYAQGLYDSNCVDFSESYIIWCLGSLSGYSDHFSGCDGADYDYYELAAISAAGSYPQYDGVCLESACPYSETALTPDDYLGKVTTTVMSNWYRATSDDIDAIKYALMTHGVVDAAVLVDSAFESYTSGVYTDSLTTCNASPAYYAESNHAIALVGWSDSDGGYWILRNSWGSSWGEDGYMRIAYRAAHVACAATYVTYSTSAISSYAVTVESVHGNCSPATGVHTCSPDESISFSVTNSPLTSGTTQYVCTGWTGTGSITNGLGSSAGSITINTDSSITWHWTTNFSLSLAVSGSGALDVSTGWYSFGSNVSVTATPSTGYRFSSWSGDTADCTVNSNTITVPMTRARSITAEFSFVLSTPSNVSASDGTYSERVLVEWSSVDDAEGYSVWRATTNNSSSASWAGSSTTNSFDDTSARVGVRYYYWVKATNTYGATEFSESDPGYRRALSSLDFDGDGHADLAIYDRTTGKWYIRSMSGQVVLWGEQWGGAGMEPVPGDYDGDGTADMAVYDTASGNWYIKTLAGTISAWAVNWGGPGFIPVPGDYDGDGASDMTVYDTGSGSWFARTVDGNILLWNTAFGAQDMSPVPGDYNGDGIWDMALFYGTSGSWYIRTTAGTVISWGEQFGAPGMIPVWGDYDGDGVFDMAVYEPVQGLWYIRTVFGATLAWGTNWGGSGSTPVPGDYNSDSRWDMAAYFESTGQWYVMGTDGSLILWGEPWGGPGMTPVGAAE